MNSTKWHKHKLGEWHRKEYSPEEETRILLARKEKIDNFYKDVNFGEPFSS